MLLAALLHAALVGPPLQMRDDGSALLTESEEGAVSEGPLRWWRPAE